jgi:hypothetical protein
MNKVKTITAKEMFEELGYTVNLYLQDISIEYNNISTGQQICFWKILKEFSKYGITYNDEDKAITLDELKAIQKQIEELGWETEKSIIDKEAKERRLII